MKVSLKPLFKSCSTWISSFVRDTYHLNHLRYSGSTYQWIGLAVLTNIKLKRFVFILFFPLLISSFWWKCHTKSWQELGNVNQVKPDQILSQAASLNIRARVWGRGSDKLVRLRACPWLIIPSLGLITMFKARYKMSCSPVSSQRVDIYCVLRPPRGAMMDFMSHISHIPGYLE